MSSLFELYETGQLHGGSHNEETSGSNSAENSSKGNIDWTPERKLKLALACQLYKGHIDEKGSKKGTKWFTILTELWKLSLFKDQKIVKADALKNTFGNISSSEVVLYVPTFTFPVGNLKPSFSLFISSTL